MHLIVDTGDDLGSGQVDPVGHLCVVADRLVGADDGDSGVAGRKLGGAGHPQELRAVDQHQVKVGLGLGEQRIRCRGPGRASDERWSRTAP